MYYLKTKRQYKASNFLFECDTLKAWSYGHWLFCTKYKGLVIFNYTTYSQSTCGHQSKALGLLNYKYDLKLSYTINNLTDIELALRDEIKNVIWKINQLTDEINKPRSHKKTNERRKAKIQELYEHINDVKKVLYDDSLITDVVA